MRPALSAARTLLAAALGAALAASPLRAETASPGSDPFAGFGEARLDRPIDVESDRLSGSRERAVFEGDVRVRQGDLILTSDRLTAELDPDSRDKFRRLTAEGRVRIAQAGRIATGDRAVLDQGTRTLVLSGDVKLVQGENVLTGREARVYMDEKRMEILGGEEGGRVRASLLPGALRGEAGREGEARPLDALDAAELAAALRCTDAEARAILEDRKARGPFAVPQDLARVPGVRPETVANAERAASQGKIAFGAAAPGGRP